MMLIIHPNIGQKNEQAAPQQHKSGYIIAILLGLRNTS